MPSSGPAQFVYDGGELAAMVEDHNYYDFAAPGRGWMAPGA
ncbi:MAG: hypothetical protein ABSA41_20245 [Terriglobia bacterium]